MICWLLWTLSVLPNGTVQTVEVRLGSAHLLIDPTGGATNTELLLLLDEELLELEELLLLEDEEELELLDEELELELLDDDEELELLLLLEGTELELLEDEELLLDEDELELLDDEELELIVVTLLELLLLDEEEEELELLTEELLELLLDEDEELLLLTDEELELLLEDVELELLLGAAFCTFRNWASAFCVLSWTEIQFPPIFDSFVPPWLLGLGSAVNPLAGVSQTRYVPAEYELTVCPVPRVPPPSVIGTSKFS